MPSDKIKKDNDPFRFYVYMYLRDKDSESAKIRNARGNKGKPSPFKGIPSGRKSISNKGKCWSNARRIAQNNRSKNAV